jgi:hypothetical protein
LLISAQPRRLGASHVAALSELHTKGIGAAFVAAQIAQARAELLSR